MSTFGTVEQAIEDLRNGKIVIVADDEDRENEGDLVCAAELVTPETINFMTLHGRGLICLALTGERCDQLGLPQMTERNTEELSTAFTVSIDAERRFGVTTGISATDRATTIHVAINPATVPSDLRRPGHIFPLRAGPGGRHLRDPQPRRLHGPAARAADDGEPAPPDLRDGGPAGGLPAPDRAAGAPGRRGADPDRLWRVHHHRLPERRRPGGARRPG